MSQLLLLFKFYYLKKIKLLLFTLQYSIGFAIHQHASAMGVHPSILNPPPTSLPIPSLWVIPVHHPQASCILHRTWTGNSFLIWYYTSFNAILPNHLPPPQQSPKDYSIHLCLFCCQFFTSGGQSIGASALPSVLPMNIQDWFPLELSGLNSLLSKRLSRLFSNTTVQKHQFFGGQFSLWSNSHIHT